MNVNNSYTTSTGPQSTPSLKAIVSGASGAVHSYTHGALLDSRTGCKDVGTESSMGDGDIIEQRDFVPLDSNHNNRAPSRGGGSEGGQPGSGVPWRGLTEGHPNKRKRDNKASTFGFNSSLLNCGSGSNTDGYEGYTGTPWKVRNYSEGVVG